MYWVKCPKCSKKLVKARGERYDVETAKHISIKLARVCRNCKTIFINPEYENFKIIYDEIGG